MIKAESDMTETINIFRQREIDLNEKISKLQMELIKKDIEIKDSINISKSDIKSKENNIELNEIISVQKVEIAKKNEEIARLREIMNIKVNEINRIKKERDKLAQLSCSLRAEVNRLENLNMVGIHNHEFHEYENQISHNNSMMSYSYTNNLPDYDDFQRKKSLILNETSERGDKALKEEAKKTIENVINRNPRESSVKSNGNLQNITHNNNNLRKVQIDNISRNNSRSKSKSPRNVSSIERKFDNFSNNENKENLLDAIKITNSNGLKLLKRDRNRNTSES
jgi:hypothetical protein